MDLDFDDDLIFLALQEQRAREDQERMERMEDAEMRILRQEVSSDSSSSSSEESETDSTSISILTGFEQKHDVKKITEILDGFQGPDGKSTLASETLTFSKVPLLSVNFKDLNKIDPMEEAEEDLKPNIRSLKNYLLYKKKLPKDEVVMSLVSGSIPRGFLKDFLQVDKSFLQKLSSSLWDPFVKIKLQVERKRPPIVERDIPGEIEKFKFDFEKGKLKVSELLDNSSNSEGLVRIPLKRGNQNAEEKSSTEVLMRSDNLSTLTFKLSFEVEVGEVPENKELKLRSDLILQRFYDLEGKDVTIVAANGAEIKCHKNILIVQSEPLHSMLFPQYEMMEVQTGKIEMKENSEEGLRQFVKLLYGFPLPVETITCEMAVELFQLANKYGVKELECSMMDFLCLKDMQFFNADTILELYYYTRNLECLGELKAHALTEMSTLSEKSLTGCEYFKKLPRDDAISLLCTLLQWKS